MAQLAAFGSDQYKSVFVANGSFNFACDLIGKIKLESENLEKEGQWDANKARLDPLEERIHPLAGCKSLATNLIGSLTYEKRGSVENYFKSDQGKIILGMILANTKLDVESPTLREWSLIVVRNLCSWSEDVREQLRKLELIGVSEEGKKALDSLGMREVYQKQIDKLKRKNEET